MQLSLKAERDALREVESRESGLRREIEKLRREAAVSREELATLREHRRAADDKRESASAAERAAEEIETLKREPRRHRATSACRGERSGARAEADSSAGKVQTHGRNCAA